MIDIAVHLTAPVVLVGESAGAELVLDMNVGTGSTVADPNDSEGGLERRIRPARLIRGLGTDTLWFRSEAKRGKFSQSVGNAGRRPCFPLKSKSKALQHRHFTENGKQTKSTGKGQIGQRDNVQNTAFHGNLWS